MSSNLVNNFINSIAQFCVFCRQNGINVGIKETMDCVEVVMLDLIKDKTLLKYGLKSVLCTSKDDFDKFDELFAKFWLTKQPKGDPQNQHMKTEIIKVKKNQTSKQIISTEPKNVNDFGDGELSATAYDNLRKTDFSKIASMDEKQFLRIAEKLWKEVGYRITRRYKSSNTKKIIDIRKTIRQNISKGGTPLQLKFKSKNKQKPGIVVFLDVSGSMDQYSFYLLHFIYVLHRYFKKMSSFIFSTRLINISNLLKNSKLSETLMLLEEEANIWSSGTTIGDCFASFNYDHSKYTMKSKPVVLVFSDGLETGDAGRLYDELSKIKSKAKKLIWITPLLGMQNYQPITMGMKTILPLIDELSSGHNVESLLELESLLKDVF